MFDDNSERLTAETGFRLPARLLRALQAEAHRQRRRQSEIIRTALAAYLEDQRSHQEVRECEQ